MEGNKKVDDQEWVGSMNVSYTFGGELNQNQ